MKRVYIILWVLTAISAAVTATIVVVSNGSKSDVQRIKAEDVKSVTISSTVDRAIGIDTPITASDRDQIEVLLNCIDNVELNNRHRIPNIQIGPNFYEVRFVFNDGSSETRSYKEYPSMEYNSPFKPFYKLFFPELYD